MQKVVKPDEEQSLDVWSVPNVEAELSVEDEEQTNAMGLKRTWKYEPPEVDEEEELVPLTADDIEQIRQAAYDEGFNQGKEDGFAKGYDEGKASGHEEGVKLGQEEGLSKGLEQAQEQIETLTSHWQGLIDDLHSPLKNVEKNIEEQMLHLVVQLTEAVTLHEAKTNPEILLAAISEGIKALPSQDAQTQIMLHPDDIKLVEAQFGEQYIQEQGWRLLPAPQMSQGSCQIENSTSNIDLQIKSRLKEVVESFLQHALHQ